MYSEPAGTRELRGAVLRWLNVDDRYGPENVVISTRAKQCPSNVLQLETLLQVCVEHQMYFVLPAVRVGPSSWASS